MRLENPYASQLSHLAEALATLPFTEDARAVESDAPLRGGRRIWLPSTHDPFGDALLAELAGVGKVLQAAWGRTVGLDFLAALIVPPGAPAQRFHFDSAAAFAKVQIALGRHTTADGALSFLVNATHDMSVTSAASVEALREPFVSMTASSYHGACSAPEEVMIGLPDGSARLGDMILYSGRAFHAGLAHSGNQRKIVLDVSFRRGTPLHQSLSEEHPCSVRDSSFVRKSWTNGRHAGFAREWNAHRQARWCEIAAPGAR